MVGKGGRYVVSKGGRYVVGRGGQYVVGMWLVRGRYVVGMWSVKVVIMWSVCDWYVVGKGGRYVVGEAVWMSGPAPPGRTDSCGYQVQLLYVGVSKVIVSCNDTCNLVFISIK